MPTRHFANPAGWVLALVLLISTCNCAKSRVEDAGDPAPDESLAARIDEFQSGFDAANRLSGVLYVRQGDEVLLFREYGAVELDEPVAIASITKIFTTAIVTELVIEEKIAVDDPIQQWLPDFPRADAITVGHLARHRAGIPHRVATPEQEHQRLSAADVTELAAGRELVFEPGEISSYSTAGYAVLARVIELVEQKSFARVLEERIFDRAGMHDSYDLTEPEGHRSPAQPFLPLHGELVPAPERDLSYLVGGGSSVSTVEDMLRFVDALRGEGIGAVRFEHLAPGGSARWIGATGGYFAWVDVLPDEDLTIIYLGNTWGGAAPALRTALPAMIRGEQTGPPAIPPVVPGPSGPDLAEYAGSYRNRPGAVMTVLVRDGELVFEDNYLVPVGEDRYWQPAWSAELHFVRDESGTIIALEHEDGRSWPRVE